MQIFRKSSVGLMFLSSCSIVFAGLDRGNEAELGIDFVTVSDPGNPPYFNGFGVDPDGRGSVAYEYRISRTEITCGQYLEFFNHFYQDFEQFFTLLPSSPHTSLFWAGPGTPLRYANGFTNPESVSVQLDWRQAAMFCNWLHNGCSDEWESVLDGAYDTSTFTRDPDSGDYNDQAVRHPDARYWIPSLDEYLKAAYYDPNKNGTGPGWWEYGHRSDTEIRNGLPPHGEVARDIPESVIQDLYGSATRAISIPLGLYPEVQSPWGLLDVLGGSEEWIEDWESGSRRYRLFKESSNVSHISWGTIVDRIWFFRSRGPNYSRHGVRIASQILSAADLNSDWEVNFYDVSAFMSLFIAEDDRADMNQDGKVNSDDVYEFLAVFYD